MEQYVKYKIAKLAAEKGFNEICTRFYVTEMNTTDVWEDSGLHTNEKLKVWSDKRITAPTQSVLQRWLRDTHNIDVWAQPFMMHEDTKAGRDSYLPDESYSYFAFKDGSWIGDGTDFLDFEEALEAALEVGLEQIKV